LALIIGFQGVRQYFDIGLSGLVFDRQPIARTELGNRRIAHYTSIAQSVRRVGSGAIMAHAGRIAVVTITVPRGLGTSFRRHDANRRDLNA
jgi:hypothetical protein